MARLPALFFLVSFIVAVVPVAGAGAGTGYLAIRDYLGTVWSISDVERIVNATINTTDGVESLADYFLVVIDSSERYRLQDFIRSPVDNETAVLSLAAGDHLVDVYWFGFHQRQLVNIVAGQHYVLNLETAPVLPFRTAGKPPASALWDLAGDPSGLKIVRRDGRSYVLFEYNESYIQVAWYDNDLGWNYHVLDISLDTGYRYRFHIHDPGSPSYIYEKTGGVLWLSWDVVKVKEIVKWNRTGEILHVSYIVAIAENTALLRGAEEFWRAAAETLVPSAVAAGVISPVTWVIHLDAFASYARSFYDTYMGEIYAGAFQETALIIWDVFVTPTQVIVIAHAYNVDKDGNVVSKKVYSSNGFTFNNRLVYMKQLHGGIQHLFIDHATYTVSKTFPGTSTGYERVFYIEGSNRGVEATGTSIYIPGMHYYVYHLDNLPRYIASSWIYFDATLSASQGKYGFKLYLYPTLVVEFTDSGAADVFEQRLMSNNIVFQRSGNRFVFKHTIYYDGSVDAAEQNGLPSSRIYSISYFSKYYDILRLAPSAAAKIYMGVTGRVDIRSYQVNTVARLMVSNLRIMYTVYPKMAPPQISLLKDGYYTVYEAFAIQVYTILYREDRDAYMLGYYLLGNTPPPSYIVRDAYYDVEKDVMHYVYTIISSDCYGQDIVRETGNTTIDENNATVYNYYMELSPTVRLFNNVTVALFSYSRMAFLNLAPEIIEYLLALPPSQGGYGTPVVDWSTVSTVLVNLTRPYTLYYWDKQDGDWIRASISFDNASLIYTILRAGDDTLVENLRPGDMSKYYYKLIYNDTNTTYTGWLFNDNGTLKIVKGQVRWSLSRSELDRILEELRLRGIYDNWAKQWNSIISSIGMGLGTIGNWFSNNWLWILLGVAVITIALLLLGTMSSRGPRIVIAR